jgi:glutathione S-transferase
MYAVLATPIASLVTILACILYMMTAVRVAQMRGKHKIDAPAVTGDPEFERAYRVQMNTLESLPVFLPGLWLATIYFSTALTIVWWLPAVFGLLWVVGRYMYMQGYIADASKRSTGFLVSSIAQITLLVLALIGIVMSWPLVVSS